MVGWLEFNDALNSNQPTNQQTIEPKNMMPLPKSQVVKA